MKRWGLVAVVLIACLGLPQAKAAEPPPPAPMDPLLTGVISAAGPDEHIVAIANLDSPATASQLADLASVAHRAMAYPHLPMAAVVGTPDQLAAVTEVEGVRSLYWDEPQTLDTNDSQEMIGAPTAWHDLGITGKGVGIAILDSGVDARHPDLANRVVENVKILGPEYLNAEGVTFDHIVLEGVDNSDSTSGHGTHVAGDAAGDGTASDGKYRGPAPEADLIGIGTGEGLSIYTALAGFSWVVANQEAHNIRVVNNSWGTSFRLHDPEHPVVRAAKTVSEAGVAVVFSAGNRYAEMTLSPYAAPWTITVAAGAKVGGLTSFSSKGIEFDNLPIVESPGQTDFVGSNPPVDGVGRYHPTVTGIGDSVVSARAPVTVVSALGLASGDETLSPTELPYYTHTSGTSMSAPQVSGVVALAQQAFHEAHPESAWLSPAEVKDVIRLASVPMDGLKLYQQGYGLVNAPNTVALARSLAAMTPEERSSYLADELAVRNAGLAAQRGADIIASFAWRRPTPETADGTRHTFSIQVPAGADKVKALVGFPTTPQLNAASVDLYLRDAAGTEVARATASSFSHGVQTLLLDISTLAAPPAFGTWTLEARADVSSSCATGSARCVTGAPLDTWIAAQVLETGSVSGPVFQPEGQLTLYFHNESEGSTAPPGAVKPGYRWDGTELGGALSAAAPDNPRAGLFGYATTYAPAVSKRAVFRSGALADALTIGNNVRLDMWLQNETRPVGRGSVGYWLYEVTADGERKLVASQELLNPADAGVDAPKHVPIDFPLPLPYSFSAGSRIEVELAHSALTTSGTRFYYDAPAEPAALVLTTGTIS